MSIATMDELAAVPVGQAVYVSDNKYIRRDGGWWSVSENDPVGVIRDRFFTGLVATGAVKTEDDRIFKVGATAVGDRYWYIISGPPNTNGSIPCHRFLTKSGSLYHYSDTEHIGELNTANFETRRTWLANHIGPLPEEATPAIVVGLMGKIASQAVDMKALEKQVRQGATDREGLLSQIRQTNEVRRLWRQFLAEDQPEAVAADPVTWTTASSAASIAVNAF